MKSEGRGDPPMQRAFCRFARAEVLPDERGSAILRAAQQRGTVALRDVVPAAAGARPLSPSASVLCQQPRLLLARSLTQAQEPPTRPCCSRALPSGAQDGRPLGGPRPSAQKIIDRAISIDCARPSCVFSELKTLGRLPVERDP